MEMFLAKLFGLYFIIVGVLILIRRKSVMPAVKEFVANRALILGFSVIEIVAGLAIILAFPTVQANLEGVIAVIGYVILIEGIIYLTAPFKFVQRLIAMFNRPVWYWVGGIVSVAAGVYLGGSGFGFF